jgi:hypothetical protein
MIIYYFGKVYYSRTLSWACTTLVLLSVPAAALAWHLRPHECLSQESQALAMLAVDYWLAATLSASAATIDANPTDPFCQAAATPTSR